MLDFEGKTQLQDLRLKVSEIATTICSERQTLQGNKPPIFKYLVLNRTFFSLLTRVPFF